MTDPVAHTPSDSAGVPDVDTLAETVRRRMRRARRKVFHVYDQGPCAGPSSCAACDWDEAIAALSDLAATARETVAAKETHWAQARFEQRRWREQKERAEAAEADRDRFSAWFEETTEILAQEERRSALLEAEQERLTRQLSEAHQDVREEGQRGDRLARRVAELEAREQAIRELFGDGGGA